MGLIISLASATPRGGVALFDGSNLLTTREISASQTSGATLLPLTEECLAEAGRSLKDVAAVAISLGPGSFTGLRVGLATALGLVESVGVKLLAIPSLPTVARAAQVETASDGVVCATLNAGRGLLYAQRFRGDIKIEEAVMLPTDQLTRQLPADVYLVGEELSSEKLPGRVISGYNWVSPIALGELSASRFEQGRFDDPMTVKLLYIKEPAVLQKQRSR